MTTRPIVRNREGTTTGGVLMARIRSPHVGAGLPSARLALIAATAILVAACASPGAVSSPSQAATAAATPAPTTATSGGASAGTISAP
jgi:hypothetical protein